jgi:N-acetyl-gamma-glutamyl-phosphate reductase
MTFTVAVAGASGYAGGEVLRLLAAHPDARIGALTAHANAGDLLGRHHPALRSLATRTLLPTTPENLAGHDVVVLALPHGASGPIAASLNPDTLVLDCGADHRLRSAADWEQFYGSPHAGTWVYGLPELLTAPIGGSPEAPVLPPKQRAQLPGARRIAVPGCNVTAVTLALAPGIAHSLLQAQDLVAVLACGTSGAGKAPAAHLLASEIMGSASPYKVGGVHRHIPEIWQNLRPLAQGEPSISFTPTLVPMARGILATVTARLSPTLRDLPPEQATDQLRAAYAQVYAGEPFVQLLPPGQWPATGWTVGANTALLQLAVDPAAGRAVIVTALDNLVKGTAGQAIQSLNLALGLDEQAGLTTQGVHP